MSSKAPLISLVSFIAAVIVALLLTYPGYQQFNQTKLELAIEQDKLAEAEKINQRLSELAEEYTKYSQEAEKIVISLPIDEEIPSLLVSLESLSAENGLALQSLGFSVESVVKEQRFNPGVTEEGVETNQAAPPPESFNQLNVDMSLSGSYGALKNFLKAVEQNLRIIDIKAISFDSKGEKGSSSQESAAPDVFDYDISAVTYYR